MLFVRLQQTDPTFLFFHYATLLKRLQHQQDKKRRLKETAQLLKQQLLQAQQQLKQLQQQANQQQQTLLPQSRHALQQAQLQQRQADSAATAAAVAAPPLPQQPWLEEAIVPTNAVKLLEHQQLRAPPAWSPRPEMYIQLLQQANAALQQQQQLLQENCTLRQQLASCSTSVVAVPRGGHQQDVQEAVSRKAAARFPPLVQATKPQVYVLFSVLR